MQHVQSHQLVKAIVKSYEEYEQDIKNALVQSNQNTHDITVEIDGTVNGTIPYSLLANYYGVNEITSIHGDGTEYGTIWIGYKD